MGRILFFVIIALVIYFGWRQMRMKQMELEKRLDEQQAAPRQSAEKGEHMVQCEQCGVFIPQSDALQSHGKYYCCRDHLQRGAARR